MEIVCNNKPRHVLHWHDLAPTEQAEFDWIEDSDNSYSFFRYRGIVYCLADFMQVPPELAKQHWHGYSADTYFSAILIRLVGMGESVIVARVTVTVSGVAVS